MKTLKKTMYAFLICMTAMVASCSSDDDNNTDDGGAGGGGDELFTAVIDGADFAASTDQASLIGGSLTSSGGSMTFVAQGSTNTGDFINIAIINYDGVGSYRTGDVITNANTIQYGEVSGGANIWGSNLATAALGTLEPGTIEITSQSDTGAQGTFSFEGYNAAQETTKTVTQGKFTIVFDN